MSLGFSLGLVAKLTRVVFWSLLATIMNRISLSQTGVEILLHKALAF
jgi:hypothetical protein